MIIFAIVFFVVAACCLPILVVLLKSDHIFWQVFSPTSGTVRIVWRVVFWALILSAEINVLVPGHQDWLQIVLYVCAIIFLCYIWIRTLYLRFLTPNLGCPEEGPRQNSPPRDD